MAEKLFIVFDCFQLWNLCVMHKGPFLGKPLVGHLCRGEEEKQFSEPFHSIVFMDQNAINPKVFFDSEQARRQRGGRGGIAPRFISCPPTVFFLKSEHRPHQFEI